MGGLPHPRERPDEGRPGLRRVRPVARREQPRRQRHHQGPPPHSLQPPPRGQRTKDRDTSPTVVGNLAAKLENLGGHLDAAMDRDGGHGASQNAADFIQWIAKVTGHKS
ncbi:hypothetical protein [Streptomyces deccanensis]|uniref:hypothetical protein n=1 Tax=Streptomyces deccanensis TaxID=424188 RepID=UPI001EFA7116|nr:hypothetical protein [Streptomyces deccanensis]ULR52055.1 hypothetical protein L3078_23755 [Streptomyces deccanensis]